MVSNSGHLLKLTLQAGREAFDLLSAVDPARGTANSAVIGAANERMLDAYGKVGNITKDLWLVRDRELEKDTSAAREALGSALQLTNVDQIGSWKDVTTAADHVAHAVALLERHVA